MTRAHRAFILFAAITLVTVPVLTAHALILHLSSHEVRGSLGDPGLLILIVLGALAGVPTAGALWASWRVVHALRQVTLLSPETSLEKVAGLSIRLIPSDEVALFTSGWRRPTVFVTTGARKCLSDEMLTAALLHEQAHERAHDTRWRVVMAAVEGAFFWLPAVRAYLFQVLARSEVAADEAALAAGARPLALFDALVAGCPNPGATPGLTGGDVPTRLQRLAGADCPSKPEPRSPAVMVGLWAAGLPLAAHVVLAIGFICHTQIGL